MHKGGLGESKAAFTEEELARIEAVLARFVPDETDRQWVRKGSYQ